MAWFTDRHCFLLAVLIYGLSTVYAVFLWRKGFRRDDWANYFLLATGVALHTLAMFKRGLTLHSCPVNNLYEATTFLLWALGLASLVYALLPKFKFICAYAAPVLFTVGVFALMPSLDPHGPKPEFSGALRSIHAATILQAYGAFGLAAVAAMVGRSDLALCGKDDGQRPFPYDNSVDSNSYLQIAQGQIGQVESPFSKRVLYPALGGWLAREFHLSLATTFLSMSLLAYALLAFCVAELLRVAINQPWLALLFLLTPQPLIGVQMAYMPDLFHMSLLSLFLLLWWKQAIKSAFIVLFIAFITRENTLLACLFLGYVAWRRREKILLAGALGVLGSGMVVTSFFAKWGLPNRHHMPDFLYLLGKVP